MIFILRTCTSESKRMAEALRVLHRPLHVQSSMEAFRTSTNEALCAALKIGVKSHIHIAGLDTTGSGVTATANEAHQSLSNSAQSISQNSIIIFSIFACKDPSRAHRFWITLAYYLQTPLKAGDEETSQIPHPAALPNSASVAADLVGLNPVPETLEITYLTV